MKITLPFPPKDLNPNARPAHWSVERGAAKRYRQACGWELKAAGVRPMDGDTLAVAISFHPPDRRRRDRDNLIRAFKPGQDAIADITGIDDSAFRVTYAPLGEPVKGGCVIVEIAP